MLALEQDPPEQGHERVARGCRCRLYGRSRPPTARRGVPCRWGLWLERRTSIARIRARPGGVGRVGKARRESSPGRAGGACGEEEAAWLGSRHGRDGAPAGTTTARSLSTRG